MELRYVKLLQAQPGWLLLLLSIGILSLVRFSTALLRWISVTFLRPGKDLKSYGSWAIVTGATDGIGKAFAFQLARRGLHVVLVGRNPDKLRRVSDAIRAESSSTHVKTVVLDFAKDLTKGVGRLKEAIQGLDVGILVNSAGTTYPHAAYFHEVGVELWEEIVHVNVEGTTRVTQAVLPGMVKRRKGAVVNIGSGASVVLPSFPFHTVYAATKAYIDQFSRSLYVEYKNFGIDVQCQIPLYVATKMISIKESSTIIPSPDGYVQAALRYIGYEQRCTPHWSHSVQWCLVRTLPDFILNSYLLQVGKNKRRQTKDSRKE